jgi:hypothetical protein
MYKKGIEVVKKLNLAIYSLKSGTFNSEIPYRIVRHTPPINVNAAPTV